MSAPKLKNCPFCGSLPEYEPWHGGLPTKMMIMCGNRPDGSGGDCMVGPMVTGETMDEAAENWNRRTDLSQAAVAAALEAAAQEATDTSRRCEEQSMLLGGVEGREMDCHGWMKADLCASGIASRIRALITPAQHDALAAHVAAEVAKARADDADLIAASLALKEIVEDISGAMDHGTFRAEKGMRLKDTPEWVAFYVALAQIGAKP